MYTVYLLTRISGSEISYLSISTATLLPFCRVILEYEIHFATVWIYTKFKKTFYSIQNCLYKIFHNILIIS